MPLYEFITPDGRRVEKLAPSGVSSILIDGQKAVKAPVQSFAIAGKAMPATQEEQVRKGYYRQECKGGRWTSKFSKAKIKKTWGF